MAERDMTMSRPRAQGSGMPGALRIQARQVLEVAAMAEDMVIIACERTDQRTCMTVQNSIVGHQVATDQ